MREISDEARAYGASDVTLDESMRRLNSKQREMLIDMARSLEDTSSALEKRSARLARYGALPRFVRALVVTAQAALDDASTGLVDWADGSRDDDGTDVEERTETLELVITDHDVDDHELGGEDVGDKDVGN